jgi:hypothetical protein
MNTAIGSKALFSNTNGYSNTAAGFQALYHNTSGFFNSSLGLYALYNNSLGYKNTAIGPYALGSNISACNNTAIGHYALFTQSFNPGSTWSSDNVAVGNLALYNNQPTSTSYGIQNTAIGNNALFLNSIGYSNTACGYNSSSIISSGNFNTSLGANSLGNNTTGSYNTAIGYNTGPSSSGYGNTTCLGTDASADGNDKVRIGNIWVVSIGGYQNWTNISDGRFKENINENVPGLEFISKLRPVNYQLDRERINDFTGITASHEKIRKTQPDAQFLAGGRYSAVTTGFIAQEVEEAAKSLGFDFSGVDAPENENGLYGLRYAEFVVPLVKAVQEQQQQIEDLKAKNAILEERLATIESKMDSK